MRAIALFLAGLVASASHAQVAPSPSEKASYRGLLAAAAKGDAGEIRRLVAKGAQPDVRDGYRRTPLHVAAYGGRHEAMRALVAAGANPNALERDRYDVATIAAVANDVPTLKVALELGCSAKNITSRYDGTALIAAAHLGWTALMESIVLGDGGARHTETLNALVAAGANANMADRNGQTPLTLARRRGYAEMVKILERAGAR